MTTGQSKPGNARPTSAGDDPVRPAVPPTADTPAASAGITTSDSARDDLSQGNAPKTADTAANGSTKLAGAKPANTAASATAHDATDKDSATTAGTAAKDAAAENGGAKRDVDKQAKAAKDDKAKTRGTSGTGGKTADTAKDDAPSSGGTTSIGDKKAEATKDATAKGAAAEDGAAAESAKAADEGDEAKPVEPDRWEVFASAPEPRPTWLTRGGRAVGRFLSHEWTLATLASLVLAVLMTWPTLRYPSYTLPQDTWDPSLQSWQMAWSGHILLADPARLWQANTFFPELWSFAFSDTLLGYAPAGMLGSGPEDAVLRYNIVFVLAHALATLGAYALARQLGAGRIGAAVAGVGYAYAPWLLAQAGHLHVLSNGGIPLALAMLARGHGWSLRRGYRPERRHDGWVYAGWLVAAWQISLGFGIGLPFAYFLAGAVLVTAVLFGVKRLRSRRPVPFGRRLLVADVVGGLFFAGVGLLMAFPYFQVTELHPYAERTVRDIGIFSPPASGFVTAPAESRIWGGLHEGARAALPWHAEMTLLPGFVLYALAFGGLFFSVWRLRHRLLLLVGVLVTMVFAMGTRFFDGTFTYVPLFEHAPGWNALRTPGRLMLWTTLLLALLAAGAVTALTDRVRELAAQRIPSWPGPWLRIATLLPLLLVTVEGLNTTPHPVVPSQPVALRSAEGPLLVLPSDQGLDQHVMLWSTDGFPDVANGGSGFTPRQLDDVRRVSQSFPDQKSVDYLRTLGVRTVVLLRDELPGTPWEITVDAPVESLDISRQEVGDAVVYRL